ncbi:membrane protein [Streptomyces candidus]|nr:membrane protein [Streptomyces candidus]
MHDGGQYQQAQQHQQYPQQNGYGQQHDDWDTGQGQAIPYGMNPADPYSGQQPGYGTGGQDHYGTPEAYPPPQPPGQRKAPPEPAPDWDPDAPVEEEHPFFTGTDDGRTPPRGDGGDEDYDDDPRASRRGKGGKPGKGKKKNRNGCACLVVALVLAGGLGGVAYVGYDFWKERFGPAEDYSGAGTGSVEIEVKKGAGGNEIANTLKKAGVVKSVSAFTAALKKDKRGDKLQVGFYTLKKEMSAKAALEMMLDPASRNALIIPEGTRNAAVYAKIDDRLGLDKGSTAKAAKERLAALGLPKWATGHPNLKDPLEGFLYPASYPVAKGSKPEEVLKRMVARANEEYEKKDLAGEAAKLNLKSPFELLTVASLVQAEGKTHTDFRQMSEVVYNRLKKDNKESYGKLQFDSTYNYAKGQSKIRISLAEIYKDPHPYNTYYHTDLPPGPIGNPGDEALSAAASPTTDGWYYFVATDGMHKTEFAKTHAEFEKLRDKFNASQQGR